LIGYAAGVIAVTIFPIRPHPASYWAGDPWWTMIHYIPFVVDAPSFILNIVMFVPFGVLVPLYRPTADSYRRVLGYAVAASSAIEFTQLVMGLTIGSRRTVDINDLISNTAGALVGLLVLRLAVPDARHRSMIGGSGSGSGSGPGPGVSGDGRPGPGLSFLGFGFGFGLSRRGGGTPRSR
jgi:glycopeptide antibiotics resistance protein